MDEPVPLVVSVMLNIGDETGHPFPYNRAVGAAAARLGWPHRAALQTGCQVRHLPADWDVCLFPIRYWSTRVPDFISVWRAAETIIAYLRRRVLPENRPTILFLEFFSFPHLMALVLALLRLPRSQFQVWLLYRYEVHRQPTRRLYGWISRGLDRLLGQRYKVLSDSEPLARELAPLLYRTPVIMPIPHARPLAAPARPAWVDSAERAGQVICWWPGRVAREKGLDRLQWLATVPAPGAERLSLVAARSTGLAARPGGPAVHLLDDNLPAAEYAGWLEAADLVLLPYDALAYGNRTSGVFVEAIVAGKPAAVTAGTWMASEAVACGASSLVVDWNRRDLCEHLAHLARDPEVARQVAAMQAVYAERHTVASYAVAMQALYSGG